MRLRSLGAIVLPALHAACAAAPPAEDVGSSVHVVRLEVSLSKVAGADVPYATGGLGSPERPIVVGGVVFIPAGDAFELDGVRLELATGRAERAPLLRPRCSQASALIATPTPAVVYDHVQDLHAGFLDLGALNVDHDPFSDRLAAHGEWAATVYQGYYQEYADQYVGLARWNGKKYELLARTRMLQATVHGDRVVSDVDVISEGDRAVAVISHEHGVTLFSCLAGGSQREELDHGSALHARVLGRPSDPTVVWTLGSAVKVRTGTRTGRLDLEAPIEAMDAVVFASGPRVVVRLRGGRVKLVSPSPDGPWAVADLDVHALSGPELGVWKGSLLVIVGEANRLSVLEVVER